MTGRTVRADMSEIQAVGIIVLKLRFAGRPTTWRQRSHQYDLFRRRRLPCPRLEFVPYPAHSRRSSISRIRKRMALDPWLLPAGELRPLFRRFLRLSNLAAGQVRRTHQRLWRSPSSELRMKV